jgi:hypothetical protein
MVPSFIAAEQHWRNSQLQNTNVDYLLKDSILTELGYFASACIHLVAVELTVAVNVRKRRTSNI